MTPLEAFIRVAEERGAYVKKSGMMSGYHVTGTFDLEEAIAAAIRASQPHLATTDWKYSRNQG